MAIITQIELPHPHNYWIDYCKLINHGPIIDEAQRRAFHAGMEATFKFLDNILKRNDVDEGTRIDAIMAFRKLNELHVTKQL